MRLAATRSAIKAGSTGPPDAGGAPEGEVVGMANRIRGDAARRDGHNGRRNRNGNPGLSGGPQPEVNFGGGHRLPLKPYSAASAANGRNRGDRFGRCFETPLKPHPEGGRKARRGSSGCSA